MDSDNNTVVPATSSPTSDDIVRAIRRIVQGITIHSKQLYRQTGLTVPQMLCLRAILEAPHPDFTAAEVSRAVGIGPATVTGILDRLERSQLIRRERRSKDRRKVSLVLTDKGKNRMSTESLHERFTSRIMELDETQRRQMLETLERVVEMIEASSIDAAPILAPGDLTRDPPEH